MWRRTRCHRPFRCLRLGLSLMAFVMATESLLVLTSDSIVCEFFSECQKTKGKRNSSILIIDCTFSKKHTPHKMYLFNLEVSNFCLHVIRRIRSVIAMNKKKNKTMCVALARPLNPSIVFARLFLSFICWWYNFSLSIFCQCNVVTFLGSCSLHSFHMVDVWFGARYREPLNNWLVCDRIGFSRISQRRTIHCRWEMPKLQVKFLRSHTHEQSTHHIIHISRCAARAAPMQSLMLFGGVLLTRAPTRRQNLGNLQQHVRQ